MSSRGKVIVIVAAVVSLAVVGFVAWRVLAARALSDVYADVGAPACDGVAVGTANLDGLRVPSIPMSKGMRCTLSYRIVNPGKHDLTVTGFDQEISGPDGRAGFRIVGVDGEELTDSEEPPEDGGPDVAAHWRGERDLAGGGSVVVRVEVEFRPRGCSTNGTTAAPASVTVGEWGRERSVPLPLAAVYRGTVDSSCDE